MTKETQAKLQSLLANTDFYNGLYDCMEAEEAFAHFKAYGLELTEEEALKAWADVEQDAGKFGAISDEALEAVVGGQLGGASNCIKICEKIDKFGYCTKWGCQR